MKSKSTLFIFFLIALFGGTPKAFCSHFCDRIIKQLLGYDPYMGNAIMRDREELGNIAVDAGIQYLSLPVPTNLVASFIKHSYFAPESPSIEFVPIASGMIDTEIPTLMHNSGAMLGPLSSDFDDFIPEIRAPEPYARILFSPRILGLRPWTANAPVKEPTQSPLQFSSFTFTSSNSRTIIRAGFENMSFAQGHGHYPYGIVEFEPGGGMPAYEIVGIVVDPSFENSLKAQIRETPGATEFEKKIFATTRYPEINPLEVTYNPRDWQKIITDIQPMRGTDPRELEIRFPYPKVQPDLEFQQSIRQTIAWEATINNFATEKRFKLDSFPITKNEKAHLRRFASKTIKDLSHQVSDKYKIDTAGAQITKIGMFRVKAIREWVFLFLEVNFSNGESANLLLFQNGESFGKKLEVWGLAKVSQNEEESLDWIWYPEKANP